MVRAFSLRGVSLGGTLLAVAVLSLLAFSLSSLCITHLQLSSHQDSDVMASNAARSAVSIAISKVLETNDFGSTRAAGDQIRIETAEGVGLVVFNEEVAADNNLPYSTNNLTGTADVAGAESQLVPSGTVHITAVGRSRGTERRVDAILEVPPFPWAIASGGRIDTRNGVFVAALPEGVWPPPTDESELLPADLVANGSGESIFLANDSKVLGDVETPGSVKLGQQNVVVKGEVLMGSSPVEIPALRLSDFDPAGTDVEHFDIEDTDIEELVGVARADDDLRFDGPLKLTNAQIYVDGDLTLAGGVEGTGILVATGDIKIQGGASIEGSTELAIVSGKQVDLEGSGPASSRIRGLFYAEKGMKAKEITLVGTLLTGNASTGVSLDHVNAIYERPRGPGETVIPEGVFNVGEIRVEASEDDPNVKYNRLRPYFKPADTPMAVYTLPDGGTDAAEALLVMESRCQNGDGDYPLNIGIRRDAHTVVPCTTVHSEEDLLDFLQGQYESFATFYFPSGLLMLTIGPNQPPMSATDPLVKDFVADFLTAKIKGEWEPGDPAGCPLLDISKFLPMEDRIRLISWVER